IMIEPLQGESGVVLPPPGYLRQVRELCDRHRIILHFDEVQVGMGRTGKWFCYEHEGVVPDSMSLAKGLGAGLPLGALIAKEAFAKSLIPGTHASTFGGNPIACAAALKFIEIVERDQLLQRCRETGEYIVQFLRERLSQAEKVNEVRGRGCLVGIDLKVP